MCFFPCNKEAEKNTLAKSNFFPQYLNFLHFWQITIPPAFAFILHGIHFYHFKTLVLWQLLSLFLAVFILYTNLPVETYGLWLPYL